MPNRTKPTGETATFIGVCIALAGVTAIAAWVFCWVFLEAFRGGV